MQWSVTPDFDGANHNPVVDVPTTAITVRPGETVTLEATASDPDGDHLVAEWWQYQDVGIYPGLVFDGPEEDEDDPGDPPTIPAAVTPGDSDGIAAVIDSEVEESIDVEIPTDIGDGETLHFIVEVTDNAEPALTSYARVVLTAER